jgi:hypothetical protein
MPAEDYEDQSKVSKLHHDAPKRVTMLGAATIETENGQRFSLRALARGRGHNNAPRGIRHPQTSSPLAPKRWAFAQNQLTLRNHKQFAVNKQRL